MNSWAVGFDGNETGAKFFGLVESWDEPEELETELPPFLAMALALSRLLSSSLLSGRTISFPSSFRSVSCTPSSFTNSAFTVLSPEMSVQLSCALATAIGNANQIRAAASTSGKVKMRDTDKLESEFQGL